MKEEKSFKSLILRVLFIIAIVIVTVILAISVVKIIPNAFSSLASLGNIFSLPGKDKIEVSVNNSNLLNGERFIVYWENKSKKTGDYKLTYKCLDGIKISEFAGDNFKPILCNTRFSLPLDKKSVELKIELDKKDSFTDVTIEVLLIDPSNQNINAKGEAVITVKNDSSVPVGTNSGANITSEPVKSKPLNQSQINVADLVISNLITLNSRVIQFTVVNSGGIGVGNWFFTYSIPGQKVEISPVQPPLLPGQGIKYTLTFDASVKGVSVINIDPFNAIVESSKANNTLSVNIGGGTNINTPTTLKNNADLEISNLEVGRMSGTRFIENNSVTKNQELAVKFIVKNIGSKDSGNWRFEILDSPYEDDEEYRSSRQSSLKPGESKEVIVKFNRPDVGRYEMEVSVDSDDDVDELKENNNSDSITIRVTN